MVKYVRPSRWVCGFKRETRPLLVHASSRDGYSGGYDAILIYERKVVQVHIPKEQLEKHASEFLNDLRKDPSTLDRYKADTLSLYKEAVDWAKIVAATNLSTLSIDGLLHAVETLDEYQRKIGRTILLDHFHAERLLRTKLREIMESEVQGMFRAPL